jgi:arginyl-tRNA synthetase
LNAHDQLNLNFKVPIEKILQKDKHEKKKSVQAEQKTLDILKTGLANKFKKITIEHLEKELSELNLKIETKRTDIFR